MSLLPSMELLTARTLKVKRVKMQYIILKATNISALQTEVNEWLEKNQYKRDFQFLGGCQTHVYKDNTGCCTQTILVTINRPRSSTG